MTDTIIEDGWQQYRRMALPPDLSSEREATERIVFFCGAKFMIETIGKHTSHIVGDFEKLESLKRELTAFINDVRIQAPAEGHG